MAAKNSLTLNDAKLLEEAFEKKLRGLAQVGETLNTEACQTQQKPICREGASIHAAGESSGSDKSTLTLPKVSRYRNKEHLRFVIRQPCLLCGRKPSDPHHIRFVQPRALGRKVSDEFTVPLCRIHHREAHRSGDERAWWGKVGIEPTAIARKLWQQSHKEAEPNPKPRGKPPTQSMSKDAAPEKLP